MTDKTELTGRDAVEAKVGRLENPPFGTETSERNLMAKAAALLTAQQAEIERLREALGNVIGHFDGRKWRSTDDGPGHSHRIPGVWDDDNGDMAGQPCEWCTQWQTARAALAGGTNDANG